MTCVNDRDGKVTGFNFKSCSVFILSVKVALPFLWFPYTAAAAVRILYYTQKDPRRNNFRFRQ